MTHGHQRREGTRLLCTPQGFQVGAAEYGVFCITPKKVFPIAMGPILSGMGSHLKANNAIAAGSADRDAGARFCWIMPTPGNRLR